MPLFNFELSSDDEKRNAELTLQPIGYNKVVLGGIVLPVTSITPRQVKFEIKNQSWLSHIDMGITTKTKTSYRQNKDGTRSTIYETRVVNPDGSTKTVTEEVVHASNAVKTRLTSNLDVPLVNPGDTSLNGEDKELWGERALKKITTTRVQPTGTTSELVTEVIEEDPENPDNNSTRTIKYTNQQKPVPQVKPVELVTLSGKIYDQFIGPPPPQGRDEYWWNDEMIETDELVQVSRVDNQDGTITETTTREFIDSAGFKTEEMTTVTSNKQEQEDTRTTTTQTTTQPGFIEKVVKLYDRNGQFVSETKTQTTTTNSPDGGDQKTTIEEETVDFLGKKVVKKTEKVKDFATETETTEETEEILSPGDDLVTYNRSISTDLTTGISTRTETITRTTGLGVVTSETSEETYQDAAYSYSEEITEEITEDDLVDDLVNGYLITEYEMTGEMMSMPQQFKIKNKQIQHQAAWAFLKIREEQLNLGQRLTPTKRKQLWREWKSVFLGESDETVRGGPVLDRISLYAYGENDIPVVFSPDPDSFRAEPIAGTWGLFKWRMVVQRYTQVVREKKNSFREDIAGGIYGRSDNNHWTGQGINTDQVSENSRYLSEWPFN